MNTAQEVDFLVVGAGPIGSALALALSKISEDVSIVLVDHSAEEALQVVQGGHDTKVFAINSGSRQLFEEIGIWAGINSERVCSYDRMHVWDSEGTGSVSFNVDELNAGNTLEGARPFNELGFIIEAEIIQRVLNQKISLANNIQVHRPARIANIEWQDRLEEMRGEVHEASHKEAHGKIRSEVQLDSGERFIPGIICAADGARSSLRERAAIKVTEEDCEQRALVANIQLSKPHENCAWQIFRPTGPLAFLPLQSEQPENQKQCSIVWSLDAEEAKRIETLDNSAFLYELERAIENRFGALQLNSERVSFPLWQRHALGYGIPGMVLVGDAAHNIHPLAGLGANLGFQDVACLAKEMNRARGRGIPYGHESVINRYQRQRRVDNELTLKAMKFFKTSFADHGMTMNAFRNLGLKVFSDVKPLKNFIAKQALMP